MSNSVFLPDAAICIYNFSASLAIFPLEDFQVIMWLKLNAGLIKIIICLWILRIVFWIISALSKIHLPFMWSWCQNILFIQLITSFLAVSNHNSYIPSLNRFLVTRKKLSVDLDVWMVNSINLLFNPFWSDFHSSY